MRILISFFTLISLLLQANLLLADVYQSVDKHGRVIFSDKPSTDAVRIQSLSNKPYRYKHHVTSVYDGDTVTLKNGERVRLLGLNTPEIDSQFRQGEQGGQVAKAWLSTKLTDKDVYLEFDVERRDKYKRLLAHIFLDEEHINASLIQQGFAMLSIIPPNLRYSDVLQKAQTQALQNVIGLWGYSSYQPIEINANMPFKLKKGWHRIRVVLTRLDEKRKYIRLSTADKQFQLWIKKEDKALFPQLANYLNQPLEVRGWVKRKDKRYSMRILHPSAITILN